MAASASPLSRLVKRSSQSTGRDVALHLERLADRLGEIDIEAGQHAHLVEIMEGRIVAVGDEAELAQPVHVGLRPQHVALPGVGDDLGLGLCGRLLRLKDEQRADERGEPKRRRAEAGQSGEEASQHALS